MQPSIEVENVTKCYQLGETKHTMLREALMESFRKLIGRKTVQRDQHVFRALDGVSFEVERGEVIGLIGRNGAGKSTLLKVLSRITYPNSGQVNVNGRVGSLLEVGTGFHDELTGRENIFLNGSILGMKKREIGAALDKIVEFADIGGFLDTPIKRYSSGMRMRLGFSVAAHLSTDVLFVDEVLAVGDAPFQKKCLGAMRDLSDGGRTVVFVSHNMAAVENLCERTIWIANGKIVQDGDTREVIRAYLNSFESSDMQTVDLAAVRERKGTGHVRFLKMEFLNEAGGGERVVRSGGALRMRFHFECYRDIPNLHFGLRLYSNLGVLVSEIHTDFTNQAIDLARKGKGTVDLEIDFLNLMPGTYYAEVFTATWDEYQDRLENAVKIDVEPSDYYGTGRGIEARFGLVFFPFRWKQPAIILSDAGDKSAAPATSTHAAERNGRNGRSNCLRQQALIPVSESD
jgi:lipopolysaccharide transport system ATP-binding protein